MREHKLLTLERIFKSGLVNFVRNIWISVAAIAMIVITLTILLFAIITNYTFRHQVDELNSHIDISVFMKDDTTDAQRNAFVDQLKQNSQTKSVDYISKDEALAAYKKDNANNQLLLGVISEISNPLPAKLIIHPKDPYHMDQIQNIVSKPENKNLQIGTNDNTNKVREDAIKSITRSTHFYEQAGIVGILVFVVISILIIFNTIRMTIFNRRDELVIMRLLGASPGYIRGPFIVETMLYGVAAAAISITFCWSLFFAASNKLDVQSVGLLDVQYSNNFFKDHLVLIILAQVMVGIIIGAASSALATRRYLKLK